MSWIWCPPLLTIRGVFRVSKDQDCWESSRRRREGNKVGFGDRILYGSRVSILSNLGSDSGSGIYFLF